MATEWWVDYATGSATNDGSQGSPYKVYGDIPAGLMAPGDHIKTGKSPDNTAISVSLLWTANSATVTATGADVTGEIAVGDYIAKATAAVGSVETFYRVTARTYSGGNTTITLQVAYYGTTATVASVKVGVTDVGALTSTQQLNVINASGAYGRPIVISGGWDLSTGLQTGETRFAQTGAAAYGYCIYGAGKAWITIRHVCCLRFNFGFRTYLGSAWVIEDCTANVCATGYTINTGAHSSIVDCVAVGSDTGVEFVAATDCLASGVACIRSTNYGINVNNAAHCRTQQCRTDYNGYGIRVTAPSQANVIANHVTMTGNTTADIYMATPDGLTMPVLGVVRYGGVDATDETYYDSAKSARDDANYHTAGGSSVKVTPTSATQCCEIALGDMVVPADTAYTLGIWCKDDADFNGTIELLAYSSDGELVTGPTAITPATSYGQHTIALAAVDVPETGVARLAARVTGTAGNVWFADPTVATA